MSEIVSLIGAALEAERDEDYAAFQRRLLPTLPPDGIRGVRTPVLRRLAREFAARPDVGDFLADTPHRCFEENQLHAFILMRERDFDRALALTDAFLPFVDNWATCDQLSPPVFARHRDALRPHADRWMADRRPFVIRFGVGMLLRHYLDDAFDPADPGRVAALESDEYYVRMMVAWYVATALAKQYEATLPLLRERRLDAWTHNKAIQKANESFRVPAERKAYLKTLRRREKD